jgi:hypothetical protein
VKRVPSSEGDPFELSFQYVNCGLGVYGRLRYLLYWYSIEKYFHFYETIVSEVFLPTQI